MYYVSIYIIWKLHEFFQQYKFTHLKKMAKIINVFI